MLQEDSNGDTGFEFVEKKTDELSVSAGSLSSMSSSPSLISSPGGPPATAALASVPSGNLLSNVPPPSELPSFIAGPSTPLQPPQCALNIAPDDHFYPSEFSPAIPPSKGAVGHSPEQQRQPEQQVTEPGGGGGLLSWMKDAVAGTGILSRVAEKAKSSVDSMITTLDPQMREFIYSGGDVDLLVASEDESKVSVVREAFQAVFGRATVSGIGVQADVASPAQPVGFTAGVRAAEARVAAVYTQPVARPLPVLALESFLFEAVASDEHWLEMTVLLLSDPARGLRLQTYTQGTPVPAAVARVLAEDTPPEYPARAAGFSQPVARLMARNLRCEPQHWQRTLTGVSARDTLLLAARALAGLYKNSLQNI